MNIVTAEPTFITFVTGQAAVAFVISNVTRISESLQTLALVLAQMPCEDSCWHDRP
jgi:hypothetical protein